MTSFQKPIGRPPIWDTSTPTNYPGHFRTGQKTGWSQWLTAVFPNANVDATFVIALGSVPDGYQPYQSTVGGIVYNGSNQGSDWTATSITLRATVAGTYKLIVG